MNAEGRYLFVYGTLRCGSPHPMARYLARHARYLGKAKMPGRLYDLGRYPGMTAAQGPEDWVVGDVFEMEDIDKVLDKLDDYEGCSARHPWPWLFERRLGAVHLETGEQRAAWYYQLQEPIGSLSRISSGEYQVTDHG